MKLYIGLDTAEKMGVAFWYPETHVATVLEMKGTPLEQYEYIQTILTQNMVHQSLGGRWTQVGYKDDIVFVMETLSHFRNAVVTRSLLERSGYIKYSLLRNLQAVKEWKPLDSRKTLGYYKKKDVLAHLQQFAVEKLTDNHTDALTLVLHQSVQDGIELDMTRLKILKGEK